MIDISHEVSVKKLKEILSELLDDDVLIPNAVGNLALIRNGEYAGFINLLKDLQCLEIV